VGGKRRLGKYGLRYFALGYLALILLIPIGMVVINTFGEGIGNAWSSITSPDGLHAIYLTLLIAAIAVPLNTIFGVLAALLMVRTEFRGKQVLNTIIDVPFAISPVVIGLSLVLVYGSRGTGWFGDWFVENGIQVIFSVPGMVLATMFVTLPFVVREVIPVLQEIGNEQEQAARTLGARPWQTFWRITLPSIRWGVAYGIVLTMARAIGEFGAVAVVSGHITGQTETLTLFVNRSFTNFDKAGAYGASLVLALIAITTLVGMNLAKRKEAVT
jgi:sulfate/thiosulfate transport system permease protein